VLGVLELFSSKKWAVLSSFGASKWPKKSKEPGKKLISVGDAAL
jgi:hypothetical protein